MNSDTERVDGSMVFRSLIVGALSTNVYIVADTTTRQAIVIDPGDEPARMLEALERARHRGRRAHSRPLGPRARRRRTRRCGRRADPRAPRRLRGLERAALDAAGVVNEHGLVFTRPEGKPLHPHSVPQAFERTQPDLDVSPIRFHDYAHTHAGLLLRDRVPIKVVSERLGHSNPAFTMATYQHVLPGMQDDAAAAFRQLLATHSREVAKDAAAA